MENFPWTRLPGVELPAGRKALVERRARSRRDVRRELGDGSFGGFYERPDEDVLRVWRRGRRGGPRADPVGGDDGVRCARRTPSATRWRSSGAGSPRRARPSGAGGGRAGDGDAGRAALGADGAGEGGGRARLRLPHGLRQPQGPRAGGEPARRAALPLARARPAGAGRGAGRADVARGLGAVLPDARAAEPASAALASPQSEVSPTARSSTGASRRSGPSTATTRRCPSAGAASGCARGVGVLAARREPAPRPAPLPPRGRRLGRRAARP